jgi:hypothetical protein
MSDLKEIAEEKTLGDEDCIFIQAKKIFSKKEALS